MKYSVLDMKWLFHSIEHSSCNCLPVQDQVSPNPAIDGLDNLQVLPLIELLMKTDRVGNILLY